MVFKGPMVTAEQINEAIRIVETVKENHRVGWGMLDELGLPGDALVAYALANAEASAERLGREPRSVVYATGWLQGLAVGTALGRPGQLDAGARMGFACADAGISPSDGLRLLRDIAEELYPGVYGTRELTAEEADAVAAEVEKRLA